MAQRPTEAAISARQRIADLAPAAAVEVASWGVLRTARMVLRPLAVTDREAYLAAVRRTRDDLDRCVALYREGESDAQMFERQVALARPSPGAAEHVRLVGVLADGRIAGGFHLNAISRGLAWKGDLTWWVAADLRRQGLALEGVRALLHHGLADLPAGLGLHTVHAWITADNIPSIRLAERAGFCKAADRSYLQTGERWSIHDCYVRRLAQGFGAQG